jgi:glucose/arabinose dehydrogenase
MPGPTIRLVTRRLVLALALAATLPAPAHAASLAPVGSFEQPVYVTGAGGRLFVVERHGTIRVVRRGRTLRRPFLDITGQVLIRSPLETVDQRGLLSAAFAPDYATSGRFYVFFVDRRDRIRVDELRRSRRNPDRADRSTRRTLLAIPGAGPLHHGGQLAFGPDGLLYVGVGFGNQNDAPQDPASPRGKILRIDPAAAARTAPEVWASGLRNPYRFSFDGNRLIVADVGGDDAEEVSIVEAGGANLGWPFLEGSRRLADGTVENYVAPVLTHSHANGWCSIIGGYVVGGEYVYGDLCSGRVYASGLGRRPARSRRLPLTIGYLVSFGRDAAGRLYGVSFRGTVWRIRL